MANEDTFLPSQATALVCFPLVREVLQQPTKMLCAALFYLQLREGNMASPCCAAGSWEHHRALQLSLLSFPSTLNESHPDRRPFLQVNHALERCKSPIALNCFQKVVSTKFQPHPQTDLEFSVCEH